MKVTINISDHPEMGVKRKFRVTSVNDRENFVEITGTILLFQNNAGAYGAKIGRYSNEIISPNTIHRYLDLATGNLTVPENIEAIKANPNIEPVYPVGVTGSTEFNWWENAANGDFTGAKLQARCEDRVAKFVARLDAAGFFN